MTSSQLVADIQAATTGDSDAWSRMLNTYRPAMQSWAASFTADSEMSHCDLIQEAWLQIWKGLNSFQGVQDPESVTPVFYRWLKVTARNAMLTCIKHRTAKCRTPDKPIVDNGKMTIPDDNSKTPSSIVSRDEELLRMRQALSRLPDPLDQQIFSMLIDDHLPLKVIADLLARDYSTIRRRFHKGLSTLEHYMSPS